MTISLTHRCNQFKMWSAIEDKRIKTFTATSKSHIYDESCVLISTCVPHLLSS